MFLTEMNFDGGVWEQKYGLIEGRTSPMFLLRAVTTYNGKFEPVVRDATTGVQLVVGKEKFLTYSMALLEAKGLALELMASALLHIH